MAALESAPHLGGSTLARSRRSGRRVDLSGAAVPPRAALQERAWTPRQLRTMRRRAVPPNRARRTVRPRKARPAARGMVRPSYPLRSTPARTRPSAAPRRGWLNVSPPGSNYASTYSGINAVAVGRTTCDRLHKVPTPTAVPVDGLRRNLDPKSATRAERRRAQGTGRPWSLVIDPITPDVMYTVQGYGTSGLWKSTNAGVDWTNVLARDQQRLLRRRANNHRDGSRRSHPRHRVSPGVLAAPTMQVRTAAGSGPAP